MDAHGVIAACARRRQWCVCVYISAYRSNWGRSHRLRQSAHPGPTHLPPPARPHPPAARVAPTMPLHLTPTECQRIDVVVRGKKQPASHVLAEINIARARRGVGPTSAATVSRYCQGKTHRRGVAEVRGRPPALTRAHIRCANLARKRLLKQADGERRVTWAMVVEEAGLGDVGCHRTICDALRVCRALHNWGLTSDSHQTPIRLPKPQNPKTPKYGNVKIRIQTSTNK